MTELDLLVLTVYVIAVVYTLYQMIDSLENQSTLTFEKADFDRQLTENEIKDLLDVKFKFDDRYDFDNPKTLAITVENKSDHSLIYVDWDRSVLADFGGRSRRVVRFTPDKRLDDLFQSQMFSTVAPGKSLSETLTAEDLLKLLADGTLEPSAPLVNIKQLEGSIEAKKASDKQKKIYADFMSGEAPIQFSLQLALRISSLLSREGHSVFYNVTCPFALKKVPWRDALPFNPKPKK